MTFLGDRTVFGLKGMVTKITKKITTKSLSLVIGIATATGIYLLVTAGPTMIQEQPSLNSLDETSAAESPSEPVSVSIVPEQQSLANSASFPSKSENPNGRQIESIKDLTSDLEQLELAAEQGVEFLFKKTGTTSKDVEERFAQILSK